MYFYLVFVIFRCVFLSYQITSLHLRTNTRIALIIKISPAQRSYNFPWLRAHTVVVVSPHKHFMASLHLVVTIFVAHVICLRRARAPSRRNLRPASAWEKRTFVALRLIRAAQCGNLDSAFYGKSPCIVSREETHVHTLPHIHIHSSILRLEVSCRLGPFT